MGQGGDGEGCWQAHGLLEQQTHNGRVSTSGSLDQHRGVVLQGGEAGEGGEPSCPPRTNTIYNTGSHQRLFHCLTEHTSQTLPTSGGH